MKKLLSPTVNPCPPDTRSLRSLCRAYKGPHHPPISLSINTQTTRDRMLIYRWNVARRRKSRQQSNTARLFFPWKMTKASPKATSEASLRSSTAMGERSLNSHARALGFPRGEGKGQQPVGETIRLSESREERRKNAGNHQLTTVLIP